MRRLGIIFILIGFAFTLSGMSKKTFSLENEYAYTESYNLNHILKPTYTDYYTCTQHYDDLLTPKRNYIHSHFILLNSLAMNESHMIKCLINEKTIDYIFPIQRNLYTPTSTGTLLPRFKFNFLPSQIRSMVRSTILLV